MNSKEEIKRLRIELNNIKREMSDYEEIIELKKEIQRLKKLKTTKNEEENQKEPKKQTGFLTKIINTIGGDEE